MSESRHSVKALLSKQPRTPSLLQSFALLASGLPASQVDRFPHPCRPHTHYPHTPSCGGPDFSLRRMDTPFRPPRPFAPSPLSVLPDPTISVVRVRCVAVRHAAAHARPACAAHHSPPLRRVRLAAYRHVHPLRAHVARFPVPVRVEHGGAGGAGGAGRGRHGRHGRRGSGRLTVLCVPTVPSAPSLCAPLRILLRPCRLSLRGRECVVPFTAATATAAPAAATALPPPSPSSLIRIAKLIFPNWH